MSFTDLFIGILFLFLILVAALMLMHQQAVAQAEADARAYNARIRQLQAELDALAKLDVKHPPFRLAIVYNSFQKTAGSREEWLYSRTVQIYRTPDGLCLENIVMRNNLNVSWKPAMKPEEIPTANSKIAAEMGTPCKLTYAGEKWNSDSETGGVRRVAPNLYSGATVLHKTGGDKTVDMQYRILGVYDDYYRRP